MPFECSRSRALSGAVAALLLLAACKGDADNSSARPTPSTSAVPADGVVRIGVWQPADPNANSYGASATRGLIYPQLFRATPEGKWEASIVEPGSDNTRPGARSATFRLRKDAVWSDGSRVTVRDLRRSADSRFVAKVHAPTPTGTIVVQFTQRLPGWRRLWSGLDSITPPSEGLFGGPYKHERTTPGLETVLVANPTYFSPPKIGTVRFILIPQAEVSIRLMERGELDVIAPPAFTDRTDRLARIKGASVKRDDDNGGGITVALVANPAALPLPQRQALFSLTDRKRFTDVVLHDETVADGPSGTTGSPTPTPTSVVPALSAPVESPAVSLLVHAMQRQGRRVGVTFDVRKGEFDQILGAYASAGFDLVMRIQPTIPNRCWICEAANVNQQLASDAEAGVKGAAARLERLLATEAYVLPLWREVPVIAVRDGLDGVTPNGFSAAGPAWNVGEWTWSD